MLFLELLFFLVIGYYMYHFIQVLVHMGHNVVLPTTEEEMSAIRKHPDKPIDFPSFQKQKVGVIIYSCMLLFVLALFIMIFFFRDQTNNFDWALYLTLILPFSYTDVLNLFAIVDDGILAGNRFIPWVKIKDYQFIPIDMNHRYYGFDKEANSGYELKVKTKLRSYSCVVMSDEMKEKLDQVIGENKEINATNQQHKMSEK